MAISTTPLMRQYEEMKKKHPDAILLFRVGDFYEIFKEDAVIASDILGITLVRRANGTASSIELAGFPHHALDTYLPKLVRAGKRVAICEQLEDPKLAKKFVKRGIPKPEIPDLIQFFSLLTAFGEILNKLSIYEEMRLKTQEFRFLAARLGIPPKKAFEECCVVPYPSLFD